MNKKQITTKINELQKKIEPLRKELRKIEDKKSLKDKQKLLGKCFKYKSSNYENETWFIYVKVIAVTKDNYTHLEVERRPDGNLFIKLEDVFTYNADYFLHQIEIQEWEFQEQLKTMIRDFSFHQNEK
jgi:hypothetical protein